MQLTNYLFFNNQAAEAFDFYARCLGGQVVMKTTYGDMPGCADMPAEMRSLMAHVHLVAGDSQLMASDWCSPVGEPYPGIHGAAVSLGVDQPAQADRLFEALGEGGKVTMPIAETSWAQRFGMLTDRYGVKWMINCNKPE